MKWAYCNNYYTLITGYIKSMLRRKNRLMRRGRVEELGPKASALAQHIGKKNYSAHQNTIEINTGKRWQQEDVDFCPSAYWKKPHDDRFEGIRAESFNNNYCEISTNPKDVAPLLKLLEILTKNTSMSTKYLVF